MSEWTEVRYEDLGFNYLQYWQIIGVIKPFLEDILDSLTIDACLTIKALHGIFSETFSLHEMGVFQANDVWPSMMALRKIVFHPAPQNRSVSIFEFDDLKDDVAFKLSYDFIRTIDNAGQITLKNGRIIPVADVIFNIEDQSQYLIKERAGLLSLTNHENAHSQPVTALMVVAFIRQVVTNLVEDIALIPTATKVLLQKNPFAAKTLLQHRLLTIDHLKQIGEVDLALFLTYEENTRFLVGAMKTDLAGLLSYDFSDRAAMLKFADKLKRLISEAGLSLDELITYPDTIKNELIQHAEAIILLRKQLSWLHYFTLSADLRESICLHAVEIDLFFQRCAITLSDLEQYVYCSEEIYKEHHAIIRLLENRSITLAQLMSMPESFRKELYHYSREVACLLNSTNLTLDDLQGFSSDVRHHIYTCADDVSVLMWTGDLNCDYLREFDPNHFVQLCHERKQGFRVHQYGSHQRGFFLQLQLEHFIKQVENDYIDELLECAPFAIEDDSSLTTIKKLLLMNELLFHRLITNNGLKSHHILQLGDSGLKDIITYQHALFSILRQTTLQLPDIIQLPISLRRLLFKQSECFLEMGAALSVDQWCHVLQKINTELFLYYPEIKKLIIHGGITMALIISKSDAERQLLYEHADVIVMLITTKSLTMPELAAFDQYALLNALRCQEPPVNWAQEGLAFEVRRISC